MAEPYPKEYTTRFTGSYYKIYIVCILILGSIVGFLYITKKNNPLLTVSLSSNTTYAETDSDQDSYPDWLEHVSGSNPYQSNSVPEGNILDEVSTYIPPARRPIPNDLLKLTVSLANGTLTESEQKLIQQKSIAYLTDTQLNTSIPPFVYSINNTVNPALVAETISFGLQIMTVPVPIEKVIAEYLADPIANEAKIKNVSIRCARALKIFPRAIPSAIEIEYKKIVFRIARLCEATNIASTGTTFDEFVYMAYLLVTTEFTANNFRNDYITTITKLGDTLDVLIKK
ncbi:MAG: hypothetical protein QM526_00190 [Alphaproteobacteria bacterium]|nr:hypothetical protein [Alphaproteobacteria bacterium]